MDSLTFTSDCFMYCTNATASTTPGTIYDILPATAFDERRLYGIGILSSDNAAQTVKIYITYELRLYTQNSYIAIDYPYLAGSVNIPAGSGTNGTTAAVDVFASTMLESLFQKTRDANGLAYFNLPSGVDNRWKLQMSFSGSLTSPETITTHVFGEKYTNIG